MPLNYFLGDSVDAIEIQIWSVIDNNKCLLFNTNE